MAAATEEGSIVYVVTSGAYSSYGIDAMFSSREKAERYIADEIRTDPGFRDASDFSIETWEIDAEAEKTARPIATAVIDLATGDVTDGEARLEMYPPGRHSGASVILRRAQILAWSTEGRDHARKVAVEARQKYAATGSV